MSGLYAYCVIVGSVCASGSAGANNELVSAGLELVEGAGEHVRG